MHVLKQIVSAITMQFDFPEKMMDNMALQKIMVNKVKAFGVTVNNNPLRQASGKQDRLMRLSKKPLAATPTKSGTGR